MSAAYEENVLLTLLGLIVVCALAAAAAYVCDYLERKYPWK